MSTPGLNKYFADLHQTDALHLSIVRRHRLTLGTLSFKDFLESSMCVCDYTALYLSAKVVFLKSVCIVSVKIAI